MSTKWLQSLAEKETGQSLIAGPDMTLHEYWTMLSEQMPGGDDAVSQMVANAFSLPTLDMHAVESTACISVSYTHLTLPTNREV